MGNWSEEILKGRKNTKSFDHLLCVCREAALRIFASIYYLLSSNPPSASLAADVLHHGRAGTSGWEYSGRTNSLGILTVPTHRLLEEKNSELGKELTAKGGEMELGVLVTVEKFSIRKNIFY